MQNLNDEKTQKVPGFYTSNNAVKIFSACGDSYPGISSSYPGKTKCGQTKNCLKQDARSFFFFLKTQWVFPFEKESKVATRHVNWYTVMHKLRARRERKLLVTSFVQQVG